MKKYFSVILHLVLIGLFVGCAHTSMLKLTASEQAYLNEVMAFPLDFTISKSDEYDAWGRAQSFIGKYSSMKLQTVTDFVIQTYNPKEGSVSFGYYVTKTPAGDNVNISVQCISGNMFAEKDAKTNAHILAYYIKTGKLYSPRLIAK